MHLLGSTILAWLNVLGWLVMSVIFWGNGRAIFGSEDVAHCVVIALGCWILLCAAVAFRYTERCMRVERCHTDPKYVAGLFRDLKADDLKKCQLALQGLADHCGQLLTPAWSWPLGWWQRWQWKNLRKLVMSRKSTEAEVKRRAQPAPKKASEIPLTEGRAIFEPLSRGFAETVERLGDAIEATLVDGPPDDADQTEPAEEPLPPLQPTQFVDALRSPVEVVLSSLAMTINAAPHARAVLASRERCQEMFGTFLDRALELGLSMRVEAAVLSLSLSHTAGDSCGTGEWHTPDPLLRGPSRGWVEKYRRMKADEWNWPV